MRNKMTKILMIHLMFISENRNLYYRPKEVQAESIKNLNTEETNSKFHLCYPYN